MTAFQTLLDQEIEALRAVLETLQTELTALQARAPEALLAASNAKAEAVARAARLEHERRDYLQANPGLKAEPDSRSVAELKRLAAACRQQNDANGLLIRGQRRRVEGSLNLLRGGSAAPDTYGRDGETRPVRGKKSTLASY